MSATQRKKCGSSGYSRQPIVRHKMHASSLIARGSSLGLWTLCAGVPGRLDTQTGKVQILQQYSSRQYCSVTPRTAVRACGLHEGNIKTQQYTSTHLSRNDSNRTPHTHHTSIAVITSKHISGISLLLYHSCNSHRGHRYCPIESMSVCWTDVVSIDATAFLVMSSDQ